MKTIDIELLIQNAGLKKALCKTFAKKTGMSEEKLNEMFDDIVQTELNNIGRSLSENNIDETKFSRLKGLSLQDFLKDNDKIIKDE